MLQLMYPQQFLCLELPKFQIFPKKFDETEMKDKLSVYI